MEKSDKEIADNQLGHAQENYGINQRKLIGWKFFVSWKVSGVMTL